MSYELKVALTRNRACSTGLPDRRSVWWWSQLHLLLRLLVEHLLQSLQDRDPVGEHAVCQQKRVQKVHR